MTMDKDAIERLFGYTVWANHRTVDAAGLLKPEEYARELGGSFASVAATLAHTFGAEWVWQERFEGRSPESLPGSEELLQLATLRERWQALEERRSAWLAELPEDGPRRVIRYRNLKGDAFEDPLWQLVQHVANHGTYHRGQVTTLLRQLGAKPAGTDLVTWDRERA